MLSGNSLRRSTSSEPKSLKEKFYVRLTLVLKSENFLATVSQYDFSIGLENIFTEAISKYYFTIYFFYFRLVLKFLSLSRVITAQFGQASTQIKIIGPSTSFF